ncbi:CBF/Mak21 family-domain-containing protein [Amanita rubescens]|nr:CBF/Mak21 family-domain-containing protein [Amanita rubescens]KAF8347632.1 CBF/Mak21 family-domain-containing protein [Amanita rubescens]
MPGHISSLPPSKKRKVKDDASFGTSVKRLEDDVTHAISTNASLNSLADLLDLAVAARDAQNTSKAVYALYRVFVQLITNTKLSTGGDEAARIVKTWLWERLNTYVEFLGGLMKDEEKMLRISALQILFSLQKHLSSSHSNAPTLQPQFHMSHFRKIVSHLLLCPPCSRGKQSSDGIIDQDVLEHFLETWFSVYDDIRWFFLRDAATLLNATPPKTHRHLPSNLLSILVRLTTFPTEQAELSEWWVPELGTKPPKPKYVKKKISAGGIEVSDEEDEVMEDLEENTNENDDWRKFFDSPDDAQSATSAQPRARLHTLTIHQSLHSLESHRAVFTRAWLTLLPRLTVEDDTSASKEQVLRALNVMHRGVLPHLTRAVLVMDWVGSCIDYGGAVGLLAFNALFTLMKDYNLDYPSFYTRLYAFLDRNVLHLKHRARFFRMTELFLSSSHLPAAILASFVKRLSRLSLSAPPAAIVMIIPFTYNILKRHPALMVMIHSTGEDDREFNDPFLADEPNPLLTQALSSSMWELYTHRSHYHSAVSTLAKVFSEAFTKPGYTMEDFLDHTYHTLFDTEVNRKIKKEPALAMDIDRPMLAFSGKSDGIAGTTLEDGGDDPVQVGTDVVSELWTF